MKNEQKFVWGVGRRKTAVARVRVYEGGTGKIVINDRPLEDYFTEDRDRGLVTGPLNLLDMRTRLDVHVNVKGGGYMGQAGATCQGLARALKVMYGAEDPTPTPAPAPVAAPVVTVNPDGTPSEAPAPAAPVEASIAKKLRDSGYLTRDSRMKERKKYGRKGARRSFQFSKR